MARTPGLLVVVLGLTATPACGGGDEFFPADAAVDAGTDASGLPPDPFEGLFDEGSEFPRTQCRAGAMTGFTRTNVWVPLGLRTDAPGGALRTFVDNFLDEEQAPHTLTDDDLIVRRASFNPFSSRWSLYAIDACDVLPDGTLRGSIVNCYDDECQDPYPFEVAPTRRIAGESEGQHLTLVGELALDGRPLSVRAAGDHAYLAMGVDGLRIVSVANPAAAAAVLLS